MGKRKITEGEQVEVEVIAPNKVRGRDELVIRRRSRAQRLRATARTVGLMWLGALLTAPLPVVHFITVPVLLLGGPVLGLSVYFRKSLVAESSIICPLCQKQLRIPQQREDWPLLELCEGCGTNLRIERVLPSPA